MPDTRQERLVNIDQAILAKALIDLAERHEPADRLVDQLISSVDENVDRFIRSLTDIRQGQSFRDWRGGRTYAFELESLLKNLDPDSMDALTGARLVASFYEADATIMEQCDDSSGKIGEIFRIDACELFYEFADRCTNKAEVAKILLDTLSKDDYGVRYELITHAGKYLPEETLRSMIDELRSRADREANSFAQRHHQCLIESLARQLCDPKLFEKTRALGQLDNSIASKVDLAEVYLDSGDFETAYEWLNKIPADTPIEMSRRESLLVEIYRLRGDDEALISLLRKRFGANRTDEAFSALIEKVGYDKRDEIVAEEIQLVHASSSCRSVDADFLVSFGSAKEAERYITERAERLGEIFYDDLVRLAGLFELMGSARPATLIYRSLLTNILERGYTKAYHHGVRYLKKLDVLAAKEVELPGLESHTSFKDGVYASHKQKRSFWSKYNA